MLIVTLSIALTAMMAAPPQAAKPAPPKAAKPASPQPAKPAPPRPPLEKTYWRVTELKERAVAPMAPDREPNLVLDGAGHFSGSDGCNRFSGTYQIMSPAIKFGPVAGTQKACTSGDQIARAFRAALVSAHVVHIGESQLDLLDVNGTRVVRFEAGVRSLGAAAAGALYGSWQLVKFQGSDGRSLVPADKTKFVFVFGADGHVTARLDCNRGRSTWRSPGSGQVLFGSLALTRASCPSAPVYDRVVKDWSRIRGYTRKNDHLFLSLIADGGIYELEPVPAAKPQGK